MVEAFAFGTMEGEVFVLHKSRYLLEEAKLDNCKLREKMPRRVTCGLGMAIFTRQLEHVDSFKDNYRWGCVQRDDAWTSDKGLSLSILKLGDMTDAMLLTYVTAQLHLA